MARGARVVFFPPPMRRVELVGAGYFPSPGELDSDYPQQVRLWLIGFSWNQLSLVRKRGALWELSKRLLLSAPSQKPEGPWYGLRPSWVLQVNPRGLPGPPRLGTPGVSNSPTTCPPEPPASPQSHVSCPCRGQGPTVISTPESLLRWAVTLVFAFLPSTGDAVVFPVFSCELLLLFLPFYLQPGMQWFFLCFHVTYRSKKSCWFSVCLAFCCC